LYWLVVPGALALYLLTRQPAVGLIDSGELAAGCHLLNILHPTGYPLYTLIGRLATLVPLGSVYDRVSVLSAFLAAGGVALVMLFLRRLGCSDLAAGVGAALVGVALPVWSVSVDVEVHALTLMLIGGLWLVAAAGEAAPLALAGFLGGLALTNHMSALAAVAGAAVAVVVGRWPGRPGTRARAQTGEGLGTRSHFGGPRMGHVPRRAGRAPVWVMAAALFLLGLSPYLFLVLRARAGPLLAWGNPVNLERLWWHVTGKQYQVWMFSLSAREVMANAGRGATLVARGLGWVLVPLVFAGFARLWRRRRGLALGLGVTAVLSFGYAVNYSIPDIEAYYLPCLVALAALAAVGIDVVAKRLGRWRHVAWLVPAAMLALNLPAANRHDDFVALDGARNTLASADANAIILTEFWDVYAPVLYLQQVEGARPDAWVIDKELLRRSWYFGYLRRAYPGLLERSEAELARYLRYLDEFEHGTLRDPAGIQQAYVALITSFVERNPDRPAYATFPRGQDADSRQVLPGRNWLARGLVFELRPDSLTLPFDYAGLAVRRPAHPDARTRANLARYRAFAAERARLLAALGREGEATAVTDWYRREFPD